ncbi:MAG TPA: DUF1990 family protein [Gaiellales bacterium]
MVRGISPSRRIATAAGWPGGIALTAWDYLWRTTPVHRRETTGSAGADAPPEIPATAEQHDLQTHRSGVGPAFHRRYRVRIRHACVSPEELIARLQAEPNSLSPTRFARFLKTHGEPGAMAVGDEYLIRMPGPWDGPVRVIAADATSLRLATLDGHLEAGQIAFRARQGDLLEFEIESWARSGDRISNVFYTRLRVAKEVQLHMWISFLERVISASGGRRTGAIEVETRVVGERPAVAGSRLGSPSVEHELAALRAVDFNFERPARPSAAGGWRVDDLRQALPAEAPGPPEAHGSFAAARRLLRGYEFADPSIVRAWFDESEPLEGRTMLLEIRFRGLRFRVGVRVREVYERTAEEGGRPVEVWGWSYGTLEGHFEMGQMDWQVWKWLDTGEVEFRIHAYSRRAPVANPIVRLGFRAVGRREQLAFLHCTLRRMAALTALRVEEGAGQDAIREASAALVARRGDTSEAGEHVAEQLADAGASARERRRA